jgi:hypothetical protein
MSEELKNDLFNYIFAMPNEPDAHGVYCRYDLLEEMYWAYDNVSVPFDDFNKEIFHPGVHPDFPDGVLGIRADDNFWQVALLPYRFHELSMESIAQIVWPGLKCCFTEDIVVNEPLSIEKSPFLGS